MDHLQPPTHPQTPQPSMDHTQLLQRIQEHTDQRFDRLEEKLEKYSEKVTRAETDLEWMKGGIKVGLGLITAIIGTLVSILFGKHQ